MAQKRRRLSRSAEFDRVYRQGRSAGGRFLVLYAFARPEEDQPASAEATEPRLGVSVGRRVGGAVERTEIKRLLREAFWSAADGLPVDHDYVIVARPESSDLAERERLAGIERELAELIDKLGLVGKAGAK
jgi:ribonuclease P protein component